MDKTELNQITLAIFGMIKYRFPEGHMVPAELVFAVLNSHCSEAKAVIDTTGDHILYNMYTRDSEPAPTQDVPAGENAADSQNTL